MSIYLGAHPLYKIAVEACQSIASDQPTQPGHSMALVSIVFAAASIEAYFDELAAFALRSFADLQPCPSKIKTFANMSEQIESSRGPVLLKYQLACWIFSNQPCSTGEEPYQSLDLLFSTRNALMHMKQKDMDQETQDAEGRITIRNSRIIERLRSQNIVASHPSGPWHYFLSTKAAARWACMINRQVITTINQLIPNSSLREAFTAIYQHAFREEL